MIPKGTGPVGRPKGTHNRKNHNAGGRKEGCRRKRKEYKEIENATNLYAFFSSVNESNNPTSEPDAEQSTSYAERLMTKAEISEEEIANDKIICSENRKIINKLREIMKVEADGEMFQDNTGDSEIEILDEEISEIEQQNEKRSAGVKKKATYTYMLDKNSYLELYLENIKQRIISGKIERRIVSARMYSNRW